MLTLAPFLGLAILSSMATASPHARRQASAGIIAQAMVCSDDGFGGTCQVFSMTNGQTETFPDLNRDIGISSIGVVPQGTDQFNRQNAHCFFRSSTVGSEICVSADGALGEAELSANALNDVIDSAQCFTGRCIGDL